MHPVRPGGTRTTDSSSPMALVDPSIGGVDRAGRRLPPPTAAWTNTWRMAVRALPTARFPIEELARMAIDPFDRRELPSPIHEARFMARAPQTLYSPFFLVGPRGCFEAPVAVFSEDISASGTETTKVLDSLLSSTLHASTKPLPIILARPEMLPGRDHCESTIASGSRWPREGTPSAGVTHSLAVFPVSPTNLSSERRRALDARHLSSSRRGACARGDARRPATIAMAWPKDLRVQRAPRRVACTVRPEAPSIECTEPELRARLATGEAL